MLRLVLRAACVQVEFFLLSLWFGFYNFPLAVRYVANDACSEQVVYIEIRKRIGLLALKGLIRKTIVYMDSKVSIIDHFAY